MRKPVSKPKHTIALALVAAAAFLALTVTPRPAHAGVIKSYCSPETGDFCVDVAKRHGRIKLELNTFSFSDYTLCVRGPADKVCIDRHMSEEDGVFSDRVDFERKIGSQGPGRYKASWLVGGQRIAPALKFHP